MINFRFHLVSLTAVFLALCIGIAVGAAVVDQATVDFLETRLKGVEARLDSTDSQNTQLRAQLQRWDAFAEQSRDDTLAGRLAGVPVLVLATRGMDRRPIDDFRQSLAAAGATLTGTVWFTSKLQLGKVEDAAALAELLGVDPAGADPVRRSMVNLLSAELAGQSQSSGLLGRLRDGAFVEVESPAGTAVDPTAPPPAGTLFVVASDAGAVVANELLAQPLASQLAQTARGRVLAVEPGHDADGPRRPARRALFVGPLRADNQVSPLLSTVDDLEDVRGRFAAVYALRDLGAGKVGHYGVGPGATRLVPEATG
ncbi:MAG TPA: copper transporter [Acidimicrobiales bacterium]|nr:copper transporter [Acidimicrobiales bacterium]